MATALNSGRKVEDKPHINMPDEIEDLDSETQDDSQTDVLAGDEVDEASAEDVVDESPKYTESEMKLYARAKKAEAEARKLKILLKKPEPKVEVKEARTPDVAVTVTEVLDKRDLDELDLSDELKREIKEYVKMKQVSVKKALNSEYIQFLKGKEDKKREIEEASLNGKGKPISRKDYSETKAEDFDMTTEEGRADFAKWEDYMRKQLG